MLDSEAYPELERHLQEFRGLEARVRTLMIRLKGLEGSYRGFLIPGRVHRERAEVRGLISHELEMAVKLRAAYYDEVRKLGLAAAVQSVLTLSDGRRKVPQSISQYNAYGDTHNDLNRISKTAEAALAADDAAYGAWAESANEDRFHALIILLPAALSLMGALLYRHFRRRAPK